MGRATAVRAGDDLVIVLVGTAEEGLERCAGAVDGLLTGPQVGDLGDWHATATALGGGRAAGGGGGGAATATATTAPARTGATPTAAAGAATGTTEATATAEPTATTAPEPTATETLILCAAPLVNCGGVCVDLSSDPANCGACGTTCRVFETCEAGECSVGVLDPGGSDRLRAGHDGLRRGACGPLDGPGQLRSVRHRLSAGRGVH